MRLLAMGLLALAALGFNAAAADEEIKRASLAEAQAMVKKAIAHYRKVGKARAMADFSRLDGPFIDRDLHVTVIATDGIEHADINPRTVGKNMLYLRDADGKYHIRERIDAAGSAASGSQDFMFFNTTNRKVEAKTAYWERADDLVFASAAKKSR